MCPTRPLSGGAPGLKRDTVVKRPVHCPDPLAPDRMGTVCSLGDTETMRNAVSLVFVGRMILLLAFVSKLIRKRYSVLLLPLNFF